MMPDEKEQLLALLERSSAWCRDAEAHDAEGEAVCYDDPKAVAWDLTGALCRLFGWPRAAVLFVQLDRHLHGKRSTFGWPPPSTDLEAMSALQDFNDHPDMSFTVLRERLESMPVWREHEGDHPPDQGPREPSRAPEMNPARSEPSP